MTRSPSPVTLRMPTFQEMSKIMVFVSLSFIPTSVAHLRRHSSLYTYNFHRSSGCLVETAKHLKEMVHRTRPIPTPPGQPFSIRDIDWGLALLYWSQTKNLMNIWRRFPLHTGPSNKYTNGYHFGPQYKRKPCHLERKTQEEMVSNKCKELSGMGSQGEAQGRALKQCGSPDAEEPTMITRAQHFQSRDRAFALKVGFSTDGLASGPNVHLHRGDGEARSRNWCHSHVLSYARPLLYNALPCDVVRPAEGASHFNTGRCHVTHLVGRRNLV